MITGARTGLTILSMLITVNIAKSGARFPYFMWTGTCLLPCTPLPILASSCLLPPTYHLLPLPPTSLTSPPTLHILSTPPQCMISLIFLHILHHSQVANQLIITSPPALHHLHFHHLHFITCTSSPALHHLHFIIYFIWADALSLVSLALLFVGLAETMYVHQV